MNNTNADGTPYFLTANHCLSSQSEADDCVFIFNYESPSCNGNDGETSQTVAGGTIVSSRSGSDFILLELSHKPLSTYNPFYAGWDNRNIPSPSGVSITHPRGDVKKIGLYNQTLTQENFLNSSDWKVIWQNGTVEPASSGGPLFNNEHRVIGQVHGGNPNGICTSNDHAFFGRFDVSWDVGNSSSSRLRDWLDPSNGNTTILDGANVCSQGTIEHLNLTHTVNSGVVEIQQATKTITSTSTIKSGATVTYEAGQSITLKPGFHAEAGSNFTAKIKNFNCVPGCHPVSIDLLPNVFTPNGDGINDQLCYPVTNATSYEFEAYNRWGNKVYSSSGNVSGNQACVWDGTGACAGCWYAVIITFKNECDEKSEAYGVTTFGNTKSARIAKSSDTTTASNSKKEHLLNIIDENASQQFDFEIYPNPNSGNFSIDIKAEQITPYSFQIINSIGISIYRIENLKEHKINLSQSSLSKGIYYIRIINGENMLTKKMIVQ